MAVDRNSSDIISLSSNTSATSITARKQAKLILAALHRLAAHSQHTPLCHFDVMSTTGRRIARYLTGEPSEELATANAVQAQAGSVLVSRNRLDEE